MVTRPDLPTRRPTRNYAVGVERQKFILDVASREFAANGYNGSSLAKIADKVGLTQAGVLHYFHTKAELLVAVLEQRDRDDADAFGLLNVEESAGRGLAALDRLVVLAKVNSSRRGTVQLFSVIIGEAVTDDHPARAWAEARYEMIRNSIVAALQNGVSDGTVRADANLPTIATDVMAMMDGLQIQWLLDPSVDMVGSFRRYVEAVKTQLAL